MHPRLRLWNCICTLGFDFGTVYATRYARTILAALVRAESNTTAEEELAVFRNEAVKSAEGYAGVVLPAARRCHEALRRRHRQAFTKIKSNDLCYGCFLQPFEYRLSCQCSLCTRCCNVFGAEQGVPTVLAFQKCPLCQAKYELTARLRVPPPTAGYRLLELDGGGVKGIVQISALKKLQEQTGLSIAKLFDMVSGTSAGSSDLPLLETLKLTSELMIGPLEWPLDKCEAYFESLAYQIFPRSNILPRFITNLVKAAMVFFSDAMYLPSGPVFQSAVGRAELRGNRASLSCFCPHEQMKVAVTATTSFGSSGILTSYSKHFHSTEPLYTWLQDGGENGCTEDLNRISIWRA